MIGYALPISEDKRILWFPAPQMPWGELKHLGNTLIVLAADQNLDTTDIPLLCHDNIYRYEVRSTLQRWGFNGGRLMLWGIIWLVDIMDQPLEDLTGGLYLLLGLPLFVGMLVGIYQKYARDVRERFGSLFFSPQIQVVQSDRLVQLEDLFKSGDARKVLRHLDELGLGHLREFYKRASWQPRWKTPLPTGAGVLK